MRLNPKVCGMVIGATYVEGSSTDGPSLLPPAEYSCPLVLPKQWEDEGLTLDQIRSLSHDKISKKLMYVLGKRDRAKVAQELCLASAVCGSGAARRIITNQDSAQVDEITKKRCGPEPLIQSAARSKDARESGRAGKETGAAAKEATRAVAADSAAAVVRQRAAAAGTATVAAAYEEAGPATTGSAPRQSRAARVAAAHDTHRAWQDEQRKVRRREDDSKAFATGIAATAAGQGIETGIGLFSACTIS